MVTTLQTIIAKHANYAKQMNSDMYDAYGAAHAPVVWAEGGEWPPYDDIFLNVFKGKHLRDMEVNFVRPSDINSITKFLTKQFASASVVGVTFECGAGKSTTVVKALHDMKLGVRTFVVQPSISTADELVLYNNSKDINCQVLHNIDQIGPSRALYYTNAGTMFHALASGKVSSHDMIVIDEAHTASFMLSLLLKVLATRTMMVLMMTASTTSDIRGLRGVKLTQVTSVTPAVSDAYAQYADKAVMVGVSESQDYLASAAVLVGVTTDLRMIYDTGLRPEPVVNRGHLKCGERKATKSELVQMVGRLGRLGKSGQAFYNAEAPVLRSEGVLLYDVLQQAILVTTGLEVTKLAQVKAINAWKLSGLIGKPAVVSAEAVASDSGQISPVTESGFMSRSASREGRDHTSLHRTSEVRSRSTSRASSASLHQTEDVVRGRRMSFEPGDDRGRSISVGSNKMLPALPSYDAVKRSDENDLSGSLTRARSTSSSKEKTHYKFKVRRPTFSAGEVVRPGELHIINRVGDHPQSLMVPDPNWRPVKRTMAFSNQAEDTADVCKMIERLDYAYKRGDMIFPDKFLKADENLVDPADMSDARHVLRQSMLPTYSEREFMAVVVTWNRVVSMLKKGAPMHDSHAQQFLVYFNGFRNLEMNKF